MPRHFSIASAPSSAIVQGCEYGYTHNKDGGGGGGSRFGGFDLDLCVAVVQGETRHKRKYCGLCSGYLSHLIPSTSPLKFNDSHNVRIWIRPGSFGRLPLEIIDGDGRDGTNAEEKDCGPSRLRFKTPIMCIGAGTGIAPLRSLLQERVAVLKLASSKNDASMLESTVSTTTTTTTTTTDNILIFGCRKSTADYYYQSEWATMATPLPPQTNHQSHPPSLRLLTAFSQDQKHKLYVQRVAREADDGLLIARHIVENNGAVYVAGGAKMARAVREEIVECLGRVLPGGERDGKVLMKRLQRVGRFSVEAWS